MSTLGINLRHMYQKRGFLFGMIAFLLFAFIMDCTFVSVRRGQTPLYYAPAMIWMFFFGSLMFALLAEVITKPFSYCMPGHGSVVRKVLFIVGAVFAVLFAVKGLAVSSYRSSGVDVSMLLACSGSIFFNMTFYLLGVWMAMKVKNWTVSFAFFPLVMLLNNVLHVFDPIEFVIVSYWFLFVLLGVVACRIVWNGLGSDDLSREYCGKLKLGVFDEFNVDKVQRIRQKRMSEAVGSKKDRLKVADWVEQFFMAKIENMEVGSVGQNVWGVLYRSLGLGVTNYSKDYLRFFLIIIPVMLFLGYMPGEPGKILFALPAIMCVNMDLRARSIVMPMGSRREKFWGSLVMAIVSSVGIVFMVLLLTAWTIPAEPFMPDIIAYGKSIAFNAIGIGDIWLSLVLIPLSLILTLIIPKRGFWRMFWAMLLFQVAFAGHLILYVNKVSVSVGVLQVAIIVVVSWLVFVAVLKRVCNKSDLVK